MSNNSIRMMLWIITGAISLFGLIMVVSTTAGAGSIEGAQYGFIIKQLAAFVIGIAGAMCVSYFGTQRMREFWFVALVTIVTLGMLLAVQVVGQQINGARRWIDLGPINLQPAELAKLSLIVVFGLAVKSRCGKSAFTLAWRVNAVHGFWRGRITGVYDPRSGFSIGYGCVWSGRCCSLPKHAGSI